MKIKNFRRRLHDCVRKSVDPSPPITIRDVVYRFGLDDDGDSSIFVEVVLDANEGIAPLEFRLIEKEVRGLVQSEGISDWIHLTIKGSH